MNSAPEVLYTAALKGCQLGTQWLQALRLFQDLDDPSCASVGGRSVTLTCCLHGFATS